MRPGLQALLRIERNTADLAQALAFHVDVLGFRSDGITSQPPAWSGLPGIAAVPTRRARLSMGAQQIELTEFPDAMPYPVGSRACDLWFQHCAMVAPDIQSANARLLRTRAVPITRDGVQLLPPATGSVSAFKFRDPEGHPLEWIHFPSGTGDPAWQAARGDEPALGIDHSAISVGELEQSIRFYELLGLQVAARGVSRGSAQQRLDALADVALDVVAMQAAGSRTPHLELLGYRTPRGRVAPPGSVTAIAADRALWRAEAIDVLLDALDGAGFGNALLACGQVDGATVALLRDPDGHLLVLGDEGA